MKPPRKCSILAELESAARHLTAQGYPVVLDDGPIWIGALGMSSWLLQLSARIENAAAARDAEHQLARRHG